MKIVVQIPCFNEEENIESTVSEIKKVIQTMDQTVEILVIDDGSTDRTLEILERIGVNHVLRIPTNQGLANAFQRGIEHALNLGADIIVNTDGDGQYPATRIRQLVQPILEGRAEVVLGDRETSRSKDFTYTKRLFQKLGSWTASKLCNVEISDAASGFRAYNKDAAAWIQITSSYTYTLESLVQLAQKKYSVINVSTGRCATNRPSRLFRNPTEYVIKNGGTLLRIWIQYKPLRFFLFFSGIFSTISATSLTPFLKAKLTGSEGQHIQSLIMSGTSLLIALLFLLFGILGDSLQAQRLISQKQLQLNKLQSKL